MVKIGYAIAMASILGVYWVFVAPRLEQAPKWFKVPFVAIGITLILALILAVVVGVVAKYS